MTYLYVATLILGCGILAALWGNAPPLVREFVRDLALTTLAFTAAAVVLWAVVSIAQEWLG